MSEIGINIRDFTARLNELKRGFSNDSIPTPPAPQSTMGNVVRQFELFAEMASTLDQYHERLAASIARCIQFGNDFVNLDSQLADNITEAVTVTEGAQCEPPVGEPLPGEQTRF